MTTDPELVPVAQGDDLIQRLSVADRELIGAAKHHATLKEAIATIADHARIVAAMQDTVEDAETELAVLRLRLAERESALAALRARVEAAPVGVVEQT
jgi:hypothetical protein